MASFCLDHEELKRSAAKLTSDLIQQQKYAPGRLLLLATIKMSPPSLVTVKEARIIELEGVCVVRVHACNNITYGIQRWCRSLEKSQPHGPRRQRPQLKERQF